MVTRSSENEVKFYFEEIFGDSGDELEFIKSSQDSNHIKYDNIIFQFTYKGVKFVRVFSNPGMNSSKPPSGSLSVSIFILPSKGGKGYIEKETNAFYNKETTDVDYDPVIKNGEDLLKYVKSFLDRDDRDKDIDYTPTPKTPTSKKPVKPQPVLV